jgi:hypothetical protein
MRACLALLCCGLMLPALAADIGVVVRNTDLMDAPASSAGSKATLDTDTSVEVIKRQGGWYQVRTGENEGWVRMLHIRYVSQEQNRLGNELGTLSRFASADGNVATGVRGLSEDDAAAAGQGDGNLAAIQGFAAGREEARRFAELGGLKARKLKYLTDQGR